jgi:hypothetical protein
MREPGDDDFVVRNDVRKSGAQVLHPLLRPGEAIDCVIDRGDSDFIAHLEWRSAQLRGVA